MPLQSIKSAVKRSPLLSTLARGVVDGVDRFKWSLHRPPLPQGSELRLHLGCGDVDAPGFVNIDGRPMRHVHLVQPLDRLDRFADNSAALVYASHCLEHFPHAELPRVLKEWCRVLRPGGVVRVAVPDFDAIIAMYQDLGRDIGPTQLALMGGQDYPFNFHYTILNETSLTQLLKDAGCSIVRRWQPGTSAETSLPDWSGRSARYGGRDYFISLNLEGVKS